MRLRDYLTERLPQLGLAVVTSAAAVLFALSAHVPATIVIAVTAVLLGIAAATTWRGYADQRRFFARLSDTLTLLDEKSYIADLVDRPSFPSGRVVYDVVDTLAQSINQQLERFRTAEEDYQSYTRTAVLTASGSQVRTPAMGSGQAHRAITRQALGATRLRVLLVWQLRERATIAWRTASAASSP